MKTQKVIVAGIAAAALALALVASAAGYTFSNYLSVGSTGADVTALQTWLVANGFSIPSISSGAAAKGYFGSQTQAAVKAYQASVGVPNTGFVGPLTIAKLNAGAMASGSMGTVAMGCPAGFVCTPVAGTVAPVSGTMPAGTSISTPGIGGTLALSVWSTPSSGTVVYKGQSYDVASYKVQASASDMAIQSISLDFDVRPWLYAGAVTIHDDSGAVVAQINNLSASNFTELTVGSDYRLTIPVSGYVVRAAQTKYLTANITFLQTSDRSTGNVSITQAQVRSIDGTGVTDTETTGVAANGVGSCGTETSTCRYFAYQGTGAGSIVLTVDSSSPLQGLVQISTGGQTQNVPLAVYDIKSQNAPSTLRSLTLIVSTSGSAKAVADLFSNIQIKAGGLTYSANTITVTGSTPANTSSSTVAFTNLAIPLPADTYVPITVMANVSQDTNNVLDGIMASTTWSVTGTAGGTSNNPDVEDASYNTLAVNASTFISSNLTFSGSSAQLSNLSAVLGSPITGSVGGVSQTVGYNMTFSFTITAGNNTLFIAADPNTVFSTTTGGGTQLSSLPFTGVTANPSNLSGDSANPPAQSGYYVVPAGSSRQFTYAGSMASTTGSTQSLKTFNVTAVKYGTTTTVLNGGIINYNLGTLKVNATF